VAAALKIYAKCIDGQDRIGERRIEDALDDSGEVDTPDPSQTDDDGGAENLGPY
jgi:hypothetical protein